MNLKAGGMSKIKLKKLTPEQETLIPVYREKWKAIALSAGQTNYQKVAEAIKAAYSILGKKEPEIIFCDRPQQRVFWLLISTVALVDSDNY